MNNSLSEKIHALTLVFVNILSTVASGLDSQPKDRKTKSII